MSRLWRFLREHAGRVRRCAADMWRGIIAEPGYAEALIDVACNLVDLLAPNRRVVVLIRDAATVLRLVVRSMRPHPDWEEDLGWR